MTVTMSQPRGSAPVRWPLVGRSGELEIFEAVLEDPAGAGLLIHGPAGVGKTRLADECLSAAAGRGRAVGRATASRTAAGTPLGALGHLLPAGARDDPVSLYDRAAAALRERAGRGRFVLLVDDLHWLDATSATLLGQLLDGGALFLLGTISAGEPAPETVSRLWHGDRVARVDLGDLRRDSVETLLHLALVGPVEAGTVEQLWSTSRGNVLFLRELVHGADASGALVEDGGVWRLIAPASGTVRLHELVVDRLAGVPAAAAPLLDVLALGEPLGVMALGPAFGFDSLEAVERAGVVEVRVDGRRQQVRLAHPLYGEAVRQRMPVLTRRRLLLELATGLEGRGGRRRGDLLRVANWRLDATGSADPDVLLTAARLARYAHDFPQVERLTRATLAE